MAIYRFLIVEKSESPYWVFENLDNENQVVNFKNKYARIKGLTVPISERTDCLECILCDSITYGRWNHSAEFYYNELLEQFGIDLLKMQFQIEIENLDNTFKNAEEIADFELNDLMKESFEMDDFEGYSNWVNPEISAAEDEMLKWDREDPSWRISNDLD